MRLRILNVILSRELVDDPGAAKAEAYSLLTKARAIQVCSTVRVVGPLPPPPHSHQRLEVASGPPTTMSKPQYKHATVAVRMQRR